VQVDGFVCKDTVAVSADDFFKAANLDMPTDTMKSKVGSVMQINGLKTVQGNPEGTLWFFHHAPLVQK